MEFNNINIERGKRNQLISLIRKLGVLVDENPQFLEEYIQEVVEKNKLNMDKAIICFKLLIKQEEENIRK